VQIWDASTGTPMNTYLGHHREVVAVSWSPNGKYIVSGDDEGIVQVWRSLL
jgi:WD40 repeat protein